MPTTLGQAYVQILPSTKGIAGELKSALSGAGGEAGQESGKSFGSAFSSALGTAAQVGGAAVAAAATGVSALTKSAIEGFADYEQLVGGVETLFGESAGIVQEYAGSAFQSAGLSANDYMETVTGFSAALLQALGGDTQAAADMADLAITDMADNANKMGSDMSSIQNAYQGFAKQNYTMLDNLKLGYGGTQEEMKRLLEDATALSGVEYDISSYADVVSAIHVIQEEMGITGTTAQEAGQTISGSVAAMGAAWQNLLVGVADENADFEGLVDDFVQSAMTAGENLIPRVEQALTGVGALVEGLAPVIAEALPTLVTNVLPSLADAAFSLVEAAGGAILDNLPTLAQTALDIVITLADKLAEAAPELLPAAADMIVELALGLTEPENIENLITTAAELVVALVEGLVAALPKLIEAAPQIVLSVITGIGNALPELLTAAGDIVGELVTGIVNSLQSLWNAGAEMIDTIWAGLTSLDPWTWGRDLMDSFIQGILDSPLVETVSGIASTIKGYLGFSEPEIGPLSDFHTYAPDMMALFTQGVREGESALRGQIAETFDLFPSISAGTSVSAGSTGGSREQEQILRLLTVYLPQLANMVMTLDGDVLVGQTAPGMDNELGARQTRREREGYGFAWS